MHKTIGNIRNRIEQNRTKQDLQPAIFITQHAPDHPTDKQTAHLHVQYKFAFATHLICRNTDITKGLDAYNRKHDEVLDINKIAEVGYKHQDPNILVRFLRVHNSVIFIEYKGEFLLLQ